MEAHAMFHITGSSNEQLRKQWMIRNLRYFFELNRGFGKRRNRPLVTIEITKDIPQVYIMRSKQFLYGLLFSPMILLPCFKQVGGYLECNMHNKFGQIWGLGVKLDLFYLNHWHLVLFLTNFGANVNIFDLESHSDYLEPKSNNMATVFRARNLTFKQDRRPKSTCRRVWLLCVTQSFFFAINDNVSTDENVHGSRIAAQQCQEQ